MLEVEKVIPKEENYLVRLQTTNSPYLKEYSVCLSKDVLFHLSPVTYVSSQDPAPIKESVEVLAKLEKFMLEERENKRVVDSILSEMLEDLERVAVPHNHSLLALREYFKK